MIHSAKRWFSFLPACLICLAVALAATGCSSQDAGSDVPWPTDGWAASTPAAQGLDPEPLAQLSHAIRAGEFGYIDRMVVVRNGYLVFNERYAHDYHEISRGFDDAMGCSPDMCDDPDASYDFNYYHPDTHPHYRGRVVHTLQSVTKPIAATMIGIALGRGEIPGLDAPLLSFFGQYDLSGVDVRLRRATLEHLLTMRTGIAWPRAQPWDETDSTYRLEHSDDWIQFTLDQPMEAEPGEKWVYNSGGSHLMSGIVRSATGFFIDEYAEQHLFGPLGIREYAWKKTPKGYPDTEGGLYLEAEQLAKIGLLYLNDGVWAGQRILPPGWVSTATDRHVNGVRDGNSGYGYQWWRVDRPEGDVWGGFGLGGQMLIILPAYNIVGVINSWNVFGAPAGAVRNSFLTALFGAAS